MADDETHWQDMDMVCFCCGKPAGTIGSPDDATSWETRGNYGSTVYDPDPGAAYEGRFYLEINICDTCLKERLDRVVSGQKKRVLPEYAYKRGLVNPWDKGWD